MKIYITAFFITIFYFTNAQWTSLSTSFGYYYFSSAALGHDTIFVTGFDNNSSTGRIVNTFDLSTWTDQTIPSGTPELFAIKFPDKNHGFAAGQNGTILKTTTLGSYWYNVNSGTTQQLTSLWFNDKDTGYAGGSNGTLLKTTNGGTNWVPLSTGTTLIIHSVCFPTPAIGYAVAYSNPLAGGIILKSNNYGNSWSQQSNPMFGSLNIRGRKIYFINNDTGFVAGLGGAMLRTFDGGQNWYKTGTGITSNDLNDISFTPTGNGIFCGGKGTILKTQDYGISISDGGSVSTTLDYNSVNMLSDTLGYIFGTNGGALKTNNIFSGINKSSGLWNEVNFYPNPIEDYLNINCWKEKVFISLCNPEGKIVFAENLYLTDNHSLINLSQLNPGIYFVEFIFEDKVLRKTLVKK